MKHYLNQTFQQNVIEKKIKNCFRTGCGAAMQKEMYVEGFLKRHTRYRYYSPNIPVKRGRRNYFTTGRGCAK